MPTDAEQLATIKTQSLARIAEITAEPKPNYYIDGQMVNWADYLGRLHATADWCNQKLAGEGPFELHSQAYT